LNHENYPEIMFNATKETGEIVAIKCVQNSFSKEYGIYVNIFSAKCF
jgi:hypothetical protein